MSFFAKNRLFLKVALVLSLTLGSSVAWADPRSADIRGVSAFTSQLSNKLPTAEAGKKVALPESELVIRSPILGVVRVQLSQMTTPDWPRQVITAKGTEPDPEQFRLLQGVAQFQPRRALGAARQLEPVAGAVTLDEQGAPARLELTLKRGDLTSGNFLPVRLQLNLQASESLAAGVDRQEARVERGNFATLGAEFCSTVQKSASATSATVSSVSNSSTAGRPIAYAFTSKVLTIPTDADYQYYLATEGSTNSSIAATINSANVIYGAQLGLTLQIVGQSFYSTSSQPYTSSASGTLLDQFRRNSDLPDSGIYHLFTGKQMDDGVIGVAYVGAACSNFGYAVTQRVQSALRPIVLAHEVGHNLSATHDDSSPTTIMATALSGSNPPSQFSQKSINEARGYVDSSAGSCMLQGGGGSPTSTPTPVATTAVPTATRTPGAGTPVPTAPPGSTATPGGGGSGGGGAGGPSPTPLPAAALIASVTSSGGVSLRVSSAGTLSGCEVKLRGAETRFLASRPSTKIFYSATGSGSSLSLVGAVNKKAFTRLKDSRGKTKAPVLWLSAEVACPSYADQSVMTLPKQLKLSRVSAPGRAILVSKWLQQLGRSLAQ